MRSSEDVGQDYLYTSQVRLDAGHSPQARDPVLRSRRVKQVLAGASSSHSIRIDRGVEDLSSRLKVCMDGLIDAGQQQCPPGQVLRRFRDNLHTLNHIARDPILCYAEEGAVLSDLRETLYLTESALRQIEMAGRDREVYGTAGESILAIANVIENRVDRLFDRMERLTSLRQSLFRMSGVLGVVACGGVPIVHDVEEIATAVIDAIFEDGQVVTLLDPESAESLVRLAAHALNVAQVVARLAESVPAWREELSLAVCAALLQDMGMIQLPAQILMSTDLLTGPERTLVQHHPALSASIVGQMRGHDPRLEAAVYQHHERLDGSGYPGHRRGELVDPVARLLAVADFYVGIQSPRAYRPPLNAEQALVEVTRAGAEGRLDPAWTCRLKELEMRWLKIPSLPEPPSGAPALSALAA